MKVSLRRKSTETGVDFYLQITGFKNLTQAKAMQKILEKQVGFSYPLSK